MTAPTAADVPTEQGPRRAARLTLVLASLGFFLITLDILIVNVALTTIGQEPPVRLVVRPPRPWRDHARDGVQALAVAPMIAAVKSTQSLMMCAPVLTAMFFVRM